jgi:ribosomal protein L11 methyltransferase
MATRFEDRGRRTGHTAFDDLTRRTGTLIMNREWIGIDVACDTEVADDVAAELAATFGVSVEFHSTGIRFYLDADHLPEGWRAKLEGILDEMKTSRFPGTSIAYSESSLAGDDWADNWKAYFKPLRVGEHFVICPTWEETRLGAGDKIVRMDPGRAFGTGQHETTRLCLEWLENRALRAEPSAQGSLLDVGTGSGVLAIAATLLGFRPVLALDDDPEAIEVAAGNIALNGLESAIELLTGTAGQVEGRFSVVIANIQAIPLIGMASDLIRLAAPAGRVVLSGILIEQGGDVATAYEEMGLIRQNTIEAGEWCLLEFERP